jgi:hypothetical protein
MLRFCFVLACARNKEAQFYAISTLATLGMWNIPNDSPTWLFAATAGFACVGGK